MSNIGPIGTTLFVILVGLAILYLLGVRFDLNVS